MDNESGQAKPELLSERGFAVQFAKYNIEIGGSGVGDAWATYSDGTQRD